MATLQASRATSPIAFALILFACWNVVLLLAGGASRIDVLGQTVVRGFGWAILTVCALYLPRPNWRAHAAAGGFLLAAILLVGIQLVPLPASVWTAMPGREDFAQVAIILGNDAIWRPVSISPGWTFNALNSLLTAVVTFVLMICIKRGDHPRVLAIMLISAITCSFVGLLQFSGASFNHPLINSVPGAISGLFANRNHFALLLAIACSIVPLWMFGDGRRSWQRISTGGGLLALFLLMILASGSRAGAAFGVLGLALGSLVVRDLVIKALRCLPKPVRLGVMISGIFVLAGLVLSSIMLGRAKSLERAMDVGTADGVRSDAYVTILGMVARYFPIGTGFGTFDPAYRIAEPAAALRTQYLNQAHSDLLQLVLEGGLPALILLISVVGWSVVKGWQVWLSSKAVCEGTRFARVGSIILLLVFLASAVDYPVRTPMIMAWLMVGAVWLGMSARGSIRD